MRKLLATLLLVLVTTVACGGDSGGEGGGSEAPAAADAQVDLEAIAFTPAELEVSVGTTVTWTNKDEGVAHTVTSGKAKKEGVPGISEDRPGKPDGVFNKELPDAGDTYEFTFDEPGTYKYFCAIHAPMTGTIVVTN